ncbi:MAG: hypothetical protein M1814_000958 [Vezdaea aestivalis]|nr:MAG: hypothetical protein M1814_000958 [Vezdaea aestivalis]
MDTITNSQQTISSGIPIQAYARLEIDEFVADNAMTNLFLLSLIEMFKEDDTDKSNWNTFYSLGSIHSYPLEEYNGIPGLAERKGFVPLLSNSPQAIKSYMQTKAKEWTNSEAKIYKVAAERFRMPYWNPVAPRNPYKAPNKESIYGIPAILGAENVFVVYPNENESKPINNPLLSFFFPKGDLMEKKKRHKIPWDGLFNQDPPLSPHGTESTLRTPGQDGKTNIFGKAGLHSAIQKSAQFISTNLWKLLSRHPLPTSEAHAVGNDSRSWESFATNWVNPYHQGEIRDKDGKSINYQRDTSVSLESWHDTIHNLVGTGGYGTAGHMSFIEVAGFDPIFFMHHMNIDRILALYQAIYPKKWVPAELNEGQANDPLYVFREQISTTDLRPFKKSETSFYTSKDMELWEQLGYAVPGNRKPDDDGVNVIETYLHQQYNWSTVGSLPPFNYVKDFKHSVALCGEAATKDPKLQTFEAISDGKLVQRTLNLAADPITVIDTPIDPHFIHPSGHDSTFPASSLSTTPTGTTQRTWTAQVRVKKYAYNGSFNVHIFAGNFDRDNTAGYTVDDNQIGFTGIFAARTGTQCTNCDIQQDAKILYDDAIPISPHLFNYLPGGTKPDPSLPTLASFEVEHVVPWLRENLRWRVVDTGSNIYGEDTYSAAELEITVTDRIFHLPTPERPLGWYEPFDIHVSATSRRPGGAGYSAPAVA